MKVMSSSQSSQVPNIKCRSGLNKLRWGRVAEGTIVVYWPIGPIHLPGYTRPDSYANVTEHRLHVNCAHKYTPNSIILFSCACAMQWDLHSLHLAETFGPFSARLIQYMQRCVLPAHSTATVYSGIRPDTFDHNLSIRYGAIHLYNAQCTVLQLATICPSN